MALQCSAPIVPVIIRGASRVMPKQHFVPMWNYWSEEITLEILEPIETENLDVNSKKELMDRTWTAMDRALSGAPRALPSNN